MRGAYQREAPLPVRPLPNPVVRARELRAALEQHGTAAGVARAFGVTRASVCQYLTLLRRLPAEVEVERDPVKLRRFTLRRLLKASSEERVAVRERSSERTSAKR